MRYGADALPHVRFFFFSKRGVYWGLVDKKTREAIPAALYEARRTSPRLYQIKQVTAYTLAYYGCNFAWSLLTKGVIAGIGKRRCAEALQTPSPGSPLPIIARLYLPTQGS
jgi:hypothetical protein